MVELWGLRDGLLLVKHLGIKFLSVKLDVLIMVNCINELNSEKLLLKLSIDDDRNLSSMFEGV